MNHPADPAALPAQDRNNDAIENWQEWTLESIDHVLPPPPKPVGSYIPAVRVSDFLFTSGVLPIKDGQLVCTGAVGSFTVSVEDGQEAARHCLLNALSIIKAELGGFEKVARIVKLTGYVNCIAAFNEQPKVINGASDLLVQLFGEDGKHARAAVGVSSLPLDASVELDLVVALK